MIDQGFPGADHVVESQEASSYHFVNANDSGTLETPKQPLDYGSKTSYSQFPDGRQAYQPALAPYSASGQFFSPDAQHGSYDALYPPTNSAAVGMADGCQAFYPPVTTPLAPNTSETSEHGSSTAEGLSEALGELKIDETGTGRQFSELIAKTNS